MASALLEAVHQISRLDQVVELSDEEEDPLEDLQPKESTKAAAREYAQFPAEPAVKGIGESVSVETLETYTRKFVKMAIWWKKGHNKVEFPKCGTKEQEKMFNDFATYYVKEKGGAYNYVEHVRAYIILWNVAHGAKASDCWTKTKENSLFMKGLKKHDEANRVRAQRFTLDITAFAHLLLSLIISNRIDLARVFFIAFMGNIRHDYFTTGILRADMEFTPNPHCVRLCVWALKHFSDPLACQFVTIPFFREAAIEWIAERAAFLKRRNETFTWETPLLDHYSTAEANWYLNQYMKLFRPQGASELYGFRMLRRSGLQYLKDLGVVPHIELRAQGGWSAASRAMMKHYQNVVDGPEARLKTKEEEEVEKTLVVFRACKRKCGPLVEKVKQGLLLRLAVIRAYTTDPHVASPEYIPVACLGLRNFIGSGVSVLSSENKSLLRFPSPQLVEQALAEASPRERASMTLGCPPQSKWTDETKLASMEHEALSDGNESDSDDDRTIADVLGTQAASQKCSLEGIELEDLYSIAKEWRDDQWFGVEWYEKREGTLYTWVGKLERMVQHNLSQKAVSMAYCAFVNDERDGLQLFHEMKNEKPYFIADCTQFPPHPADEVVIVRIWQYCKNDAIPQAVEKEVVSIPFSQDHAKLLAGPGWKSVGEKRSAADGDNVAREAKLTRLEAPPAPRGSGLPPLHPSRAQAAKALVGSEQSRVRTSNPSSRTNSPKRAEVARQVMATAEGRSRSRTPSAQHPAQSRAQLAASLGRSPQPAPPSCSSPPAGSRALFARNLAAKM